MSDIEKLEVMNRPLKVLGSFQCEGQPSTSDGKAVTSGITASTTQTLAGATALVAEFNVIGTCANASDAVKLPDLLPGQKCYIKNSGAQVAAVWPATTSRKINGGTLAAVDGTTLGVGSTRVYVGDDDSINYVSFELNIQAHVNA